MNFEKSISFAFWSTIQYSFDDNVFSNKLSVSDTLSYFSVYLCNAEFFFTLGLCLPMKRRKNPQNWGVGAGGLEFPQEVTKCFIVMLIIPTPRSRCQDAFAPMRNDSIAAIFLSKLICQDSPAIPARSYGFPLKPAPPSHLSLQHIFYFTLGNFPQR